MRTASRFILLLCTATMLYPQTPVRQARFALEINEDGFPPHFVIVPEGGVDSTLTSAYLHPLRGQDFRDSEKARPSARKGHRHGRSSCQYIGSFGTPCP